MNINNLKVEIDPREDVNKNVFYLGKLKFPGTIDLRSGVTFLIFNSEDDEEELQIAVNDKENASYSRYTRKKDRLEVKLDSRTDQHDKRFYIAKIQFNGYIQCNSEVVFLIFTSREGSEEIQIVGEIVSSSDKTQPARRGVEIITVPNRANLKYDYD